MRLDAFRIRLALMGAGVLGLCFYLLAGGRLGPGDEGTIQIEYGAYPESFEGMQVAIDGSPVGVLESIGAATRTGFLVKEGRHLVRVIDERFACRGRIVNVESGRTVMLVMNVGETAAADGAAKPEIVFE